MSFPDFIPDLNDPGGVIPVSFMNFAGRAGDADITIYRALGVAHPNFLHTPPKKAERIENACQNSKYTRFMSVRTECLCTVSCSRNRYAATNGHSVAGNSYASEY